MTYLEQAIEKLDAEAKSGKFGSKATAMKSAVLDALKGFCRQDDEFSQAVVQGGSFAECMSAVEKGVGSSISDIDAYTRAVQFYFPGALIKTQMTIDLIGEAAPAEDAAPEKKSGIVIDLSDFL